MRYKKKKKIAMPVVVILIVTFLIAGAASVYAVVDDHTVQGKNPQGTVISLFDYWVDEQNSVDYSPTPNLNSGINKNRDLKFSKGEGNDKQFNRWTKSNNPYSGMVEKTLNSNGYPNLVKSENITSPLDYLFNENDSTTDGSAKVEGKKAYTNVGGLMQVDDEGYYYYDSTKNFASYDSAFNGVKLYDKAGVYYRGTLGQFFPFNSGSDVFTESNSALSSKPGITADSNNVNHWFGASMSTHFLHPEGGKTTRNQDITYEFGGDDDVWVFIDDVLVGDLGGIHDAASLKINFSTGEVRINDNPDGTLKSKYEAAGKSSETRWEGNTYAGGTYHTLKFFYLERGNYASNMSLKFNLKLMPDNEAYKVDQDENALSGATFALYEAEKKDGEYTKKGGQLCKGVTDAGGSLKLKADDGATINFEELYKKDVGPYFILEETEAPAGYRSAKDVWLKYDPKTGVITTENLWDTGIQANARIMVTAPADLYDINGNRIEINDKGQLTKGSIFAVIHKRNNLKDIRDTNNWSSISGSVLTGWKANPDKGLASALTGNKYEFKLNSMAAYETTLDELPGDITTYVNTIVNENEGKSTETVLRELQENARYSLGFYYTTGSVEDATVKNTVRLNDGIGIIAPNPDAKRFEYQYAVKLTVTDVTNDLYVKKFKKGKVDLKNQDGALNGVTFALYREDQTTLGSRILPGDPVLKGDAEPVATRTTETLNDPYRGDDSGMACFRKLENGIYYLKEISAPSGYKVRDDLIKVVVNDYGVFADAGAENDGIYVGRGGYGTLLKSMEQFAVSNDIDNTLTNVQVNLRVSSEAPDEEGFWNNDSQLKHDEPLHLKYLTADGTNGRSRYQVYDPDNGETDEIQEHADFFMTDTGWPSLSLKQCNEHKTDNPYSQRTELGDKELFHLFVLRTMVLMEDETVGDLEISKTVKNDSSKTSFADKEFKFNVNLWKTTKDDDDKETTTPVSGTFKYVVKGPGATDSEEKTLVINGEGNATLQLKDGQTAVIEDLPAGTEYQVTEDLGNETFWDVKSSVDGGPQTDSRISEGKIPEPAEDGSKQKSTVAYENTYHPAAASAGIPVEKQFNGWTLPGFKDETFDIRLTGIESTGGAIKDTMPGAMQDTTDGDWYLIKNMGKKNDGQTGSVSDAVFDGMTFTKTGTYAYTVKEIRGSQGGITYSSAIYEVVITVTDDKEGKLTAVMTMKKAIDDNGEALQEKPQADKAVFQNTYNSQEKGISFIVHKTYSNATGSDQLTDNQFQFQLEAVTEGAPMPENTKDGKSIAPSTPGGRVDFPNTTFDTDDQGETFVYKVSEVIPKGAENGTLNGTTYDRNAYYIQVAVTAEGGSGAGVNTEIKYYRDAACTQEIKPGSKDLYQAEQGVYRLWFKNSYTAEPAKVAIQGSKTLDGRDMTEGEFSFTLEGANDTTKEAMKDRSIQGATNGKLTAAAPAAKDGSAENFVFSDLTFTKVGTYTFNVKETIPDGAKNNTLKGVTYDTNVGTVTVQVTDKDVNGNKTGQLTAEVSYENSKHQSTDLAQFVNEYAESGSAKIEGTKNLTGRDFKDGDSFTFTATPKNGAPAPKDKDGQDIREVTITPNSGASAKIDFGTVNFNQAEQSYIYELKEKQPEGEKKGIEYDTTTYTLTLTAKANDPKDGKLTIEQTLKAGDKDADQIVWNNQYKPTGSLKLDATKTLTGRKWKQNDSFIFELWAYKSDVLLNALDKTKTRYTEKEDSISFGTATATAPAAGAENQQTVKIDFETLHFTKASKDGPFEFYITEIPGNDKGMNYDSQPHRIPVNVTDDGEGHLTAEVAEHSITNLNFNNVYNSSIEYSNEAGLVIQKTLNGRDMTVGQFEFTVEAQCSGSGDTAVTAHQAAGKLGFGQGETKKTFQSGAANDGQSSSIDILSGQTVSFNQDDAGKTFRYKVTETKGGADGYTNDKTKYQVDLAVQDRGAGAMEVTTTVTDVTHDPNNVVSTTEVSSGDSDGKKIAVIPFTNSYSASGDLGGQDSAKIKASKTLNGRDMKKDEFTFQVTNAKDTKEQKTVLSTGKNAAAEAGQPGAVDFAEIKYTTAQLKQDVENGLAVKADNKYTYQYEVSEVMENLPAGVSPEEGSFAVTVTVTDNGNGTLTAAVTYPDDKNKLDFVNDYDTKTVSVPIKGIKSLELEGEAAMTIEDIEGKYDFALTGKETTASADAAVPMPTLNGKTMTSAKNDRTGEIDFGHITLQASDFEGIAADAQGNRTRTFEYKITEKGNVDGVVNDREATKTVSITVTYNSKEKSFTVSGLPESAAFQFINIYGITSTDVNADTLFSVDKILKGRDLKDGEFRFELLEIVDDEAVVIAKGTHGAASAGKASVVDFGKITYDAPGEHDYLIREVVPAGGRDANTVYDTRTYSVHVSVTDQKDGTLKVTSDASGDEPMTFLNKQASKNPSGGDDPNGGNGGNGDSHTRTGDQTPIAMAILLLLISACAGTLVLGLRRSSAK